MDEGSAGEVAAGAGAPPGDADVDRSELQAGRRTTNVNDMQIDATAPALRRAPCASRPNPPALPRRRFTAAI